MQDRLRFAGGVFAFVRGFLATAEALGTDAGMISGGSRIPDDNSRCVEARCTC